MSERHLSAFVRQLRRALGPREVSGLTDAQLLKRFSAQRDEAAFEVLVARHGALVLGVCRRLLNQEQDVEDAFQATFLTLAVKADGVRAGQALAAWLYRVAFRVALALRNRPDSVSVPCSEPTALTTDDPVRAAIVRERRQVLDEEIQRLPAKYREAVVLCYLTGRTTDEAARDLRCPRGTVATRLAWARRLLRTRLARRGLVPSALALAPVVTERLVHAVPPGLLTATVRAARLFAEGAAAAESLAATPCALASKALRRMFVLKLLRLAGIALVAGMLGAGLLAYRANHVVGGGSPSALAGADGQALTVVTPWRVRALLRTYAGPVAAVVFSPDGQTLATAGPAPDGKGEVRLWEVPTAKERHTLHLEGPVTALAFSADGKRLVSANHREQIPAVVKAWHVETGREESASAGNARTIETLAFDPTGRLWATGAEREPGLSHLTLKTWTVWPEGVIGNLDDATAGPMAFSVDGRFRAVGEGESASSNGPPTVKVWDVFSQEDFCALRGTSGPLAVLACAPARSEVATLEGHAGQMKVTRWDPGTGLPKAPLPNDAGPFRTLAVAPSGACLVAGGDGTLRFWDVTASPPSCWARAVPGVVRALAFSPDGALLVVGYEDGAVQLWAR
jgi:RNA polymerase sigma factor (sigma-70 family)